MNSGRGCDGSNRGSLNSGGSRLGTELAAFFYSRSRLANLKLTVIVCVTAGKVVETVLLAVNTLTLVVLAMTRAPQMTV